MPKTAYGRLRDRIRREEEKIDRKMAKQVRAARFATLAAQGRLKPARSPNEVLVRENLIRKVKPSYCNAKKKNGERCKLPAGFGTPHYGTGTCKHHGGFLPAHVKKAHKEIAKREAILLGAPKEINPLDAIIWCIQIKAGEVQWLSEKIVELDEDDWIEDSLAGRRFNLYARQRDDATKSLVEFSKIAVSLGLAERAVKLAEQYGAMLAALIQGILNDLNLTIGQAERAPAIVRKHLILVQGGLAAGELPPAFRTEDKEEVAS